MMTRRFASTAMSLGVVAAASMMIAQLADAQQPHTTAKLVSLSSLVAQGFEINAVTDNQSGVASTLVLQKDKDVYLCDAKELSIQPTAFECWPVK
jgi:hypothetical protein